MPNISLLYNVQYIELHVCTAVFRIRILISNFDGCGSWSWSVCNNIGFKHFSFYINIYCDIFLYQLEFLSSVLIKQWADSNPDPAKWSGSAGWILIRITVYRTCSISTDDIPVMALILPMWNHELQFMSYWLSFIFAK